MPIIYHKFFELLKDKGMSTYTIRRDHIIGVAALEKMRKSEGHIDTRTIERICAALHCQPGDTHLSDPPLRGLYPLNRRTRYS